MNNYKYKVVYSSKFKKSLKRVLKQGKDINKLEKIILLLATKDVLEPTLKDHILINDNRFHECRELHIEPDWLLVYQYQNDELLLLLVDTGSHSYLFK